MSNNDLTNLMQETAKDAVSYAAQEHQLTLDNSKASLALVDKILSSLHFQQQQKALTAQELFTLCNIFGAYIGEIFIATAGGNWTQNTTDTSAPYVAVSYLDKEYPFASICYHKITQDVAISLQAYIRQALTNAMQ